MFISFEGLDGSGKTTQLRLLADFLREAGYQVLTTREPGGTAIGDQIREVLHNLDNQQMHPHAELLLYAASRAQLVNEVIRPQLQAGKIVMSDRFADSTLAYQGYGHGLDLDTLRRILNFATGGLKPDVTVYIDISAIEGLKRRQQAAAEGGEWNRLDALALEFHQRVESGYRALIEEDPGRWLVIDALGSAEAVQERIRHALKPYLEKMTSAYGKT